MYLFNEMLVETIPWKVIKSLENQELYVWYMDHSTIRYLGDDFQLEGRSQIRIVRSSDADINVFLSSLNLIEKITPC